MRDLLPEEAAAFDALQAVIEARALRYGYPRIVTSGMEVVTAINIGDKIKTIKID